MIPKKAALKKTWRLLVASVLLCLFFPVGPPAAEDPVDRSQSFDYREKAAPPADKDTEQFPVPPPLVYQSLYPCQACHQKNIRGVNSQLEQGNAFLGTYLHLPDPQPRVLVRMHRDINLNHAKWMWCLNCHSIDERNYLKLITGEQIPFEKSYRLCGQCHGSIFRDWRIGIHGRRVGQWNGKKLYLLCTHCHDPHQPVFRKLPGMDSPRLPSYGRWDTAEAPE